MNKQRVLNQLKATKAFLDRSTDVLTEDDSAVTPVEGMMTAAQQFAHIALTVDWFIEGAFGKGFDSDFEKIDKQIDPITSLTVARAWCDCSFKNAIDTVTAQTEEQLHELTPEGPIMGGTPKALVLLGIVEHTSHHRGALTVYARLTGKVPSMPYM